jgi:excisionase family DNA binding protein
MKALEQKLENLTTQLEKLYGDLPSKSEYQSVSERIHSGEGLTSIKELCSYHGVCVATVYNWIAKGSVPAPIKIGGIVRFKNSDLLAMEQS